MQTVPPRSASIGHRSAVGILVCQWLVGAAVWLLSQYATAAREDEPAVEADSLVDPQWLQTVQHRTMGIREPERDAYYRILRVMADTPATELRRRARRTLQQRLRILREREPDNPRYQRPADEFPTFVDLFLHPEERTGDVVTLRGHTRRVVPFIAGENDQGLQTLYEVWLYTSDSQTNPAVIICSEIPAEFPLGERLVDGVEVTGCFFKLYGYKAQDAARLAPMILAGRLDWHPPAVDERPAVDPLWYYVGGGAVLAVIVGAAAIAGRRARRRRRALLEAAIGGEPDRPVSGDSASAPGSP